MKLVYIVVLAILALAISVLLIAGCSKSSAPVVPAETPSPTPVPLSFPLAVYPSPAPQPSPASTPDTSYFATIKLRPEWTARLDKVIAGILRDKERYEKIQDMRPNGMPWHVVGGIHERESSRNFARHLHEGSPLIYRTRDIPKNRLPPPKEPPFSWEESSEDALYILKHEDKVDWQNVSAALDAIEAYNGLGYRRYHPDVRSPYVFSSTTLYERGKYIADGRFSSVSVDQQVGVAGLWKRMIERGLL